MVHQPGEGERHGLGSSELIIKATGEDTGDSFFLSETTIAPAFLGPPPHVHDMFYVLEGALTLRLGEQTHRLQAGSFVCVPPGVVHTFRNDGDVPVRFLNFNTPAGWEHYMRDLSKAAQAGDLTPETIGRVASRHDFRAI